MIGVPDVHWVFQKTAGSAALVAVRGPPHLKIVG